jgi:tRNA (adenine57-N1/adenine58-N1)-methyltransferase
MRSQRGALQPGDRVQLTDTKGRMHTITLEAGKEFHTSKGALSHDALIGGPEGVTLTSAGGMEYLAFRPLLVDYTLSMPRGATIVYPKDAAQIVHFADVFPGARVLEAGAGSGALSCALLRAVGHEGSLISYERREDFHAVARRNVEQWFGELPPTWELRLGDLVDAGGSIEYGSVDRIVLDMLAPWECQEVVADALSPGGVVCAYLATTTQLSRTVEAWRADGRFAEPVAWESFIRGWHVLDLSVRPDHRMIAHTGFLCTARRLADGVSPPRRHRRPVSQASQDAAAARADALAQESGPATTEPSERRLT